MNQSDETELAKLFEDHRRMLRAHCYRMLGSSHDSDDMLQETFVRAVRAWPSLEERAAVRGWLHRIATHVCLDELARRNARPRERGLGLGPPHEPGHSFHDPTPDAEWLEPFPDAWVDAADPAARYTAKESVALAFVAALQVLTPAQRAVLLLRDVVGLSAEETASALDSSVSSANSALHRARVAIELRVGARAAWSPEAMPVDHALLERYLRAWESGDLPTIIALLHEEATLSMPPTPIWLGGRDDIARFFTGRLASALERRTFRTVAYAANGRPGVAFYRRSEDGIWPLYALHVLELKDGRIAAIDHFMSKSALRTLFAAGLSPHMT